MHSQSTPNFQLPSALYPSASLSRPCTPLLFVRSGMRSLMLALSFMALFCSSCVRESFVISPDEIVTISEFSQVTFPAISAPGTEVVYAEFDVSFRQANGWPHTVRVVELISSYPSGPVPDLYLGQTILYRKLLEHCHAPAINPDLTSH